MRRTRQLALRAALAIGIAILLFKMAMAQVPSHPPGSVCATQTFWCWAQTFGVVGQACQCPVAGGTVRGIYV
jgi:hypothetical protein